MSQMRLKELPPEVLASLIRTTWFYRALFLLALLASPIVVIEMAVISRKWEIAVVAGTTTAIWLLGAISAAVRTWREWRVVRYLKERG